MTTSQTSAAPGSAGSGTALITGASTGIGAVYADRLAKRGHDLILVARDKQRLEALAARLRSETGRKVEVLPADLGNPANLRVVEERLRSDAAITTLINNAGVAVAGTLDVVDPDRLEAMIGINVTALTRLSVAITPRLIARRGGTVVNIASILALVPEMFSATYNATKAYVLSFTQSMQAELGQHGIRVQAVLPGATRTEIWERAGADVNALPPEMVMQVDEMVDAALAGFDAGELVTLPALPDAGQWDSFVKARQAMVPNLSRSHAAARYGVKQVVAA
ncbi:MAG TPA: SDR family oxidoreductase [Terriglobia bacterium]|nr:SDR family oxidoreductase [Terriglobia bacterium]